MNDVKNWLRWFALTSHPLKRVTDGAFKGGIGSAALVDHHGRWFALMAQHVVKPKSEGWAIDIGTLSSQGLAVHYLGACHYVLQVQGTRPDLTLIDFCLSEVPVDLNTVFQERTP